MLSFNTFLPCPPFLFEHGIEEYDKNEKQEIIPWVLESTRLSEGIFKLLP